jgi:hypothetical protein
MGLSHSHQAAAAAARVAAPRAAFRGHGRPTDFADRSAKRERVVQRDSTMRLVRDQAGEPGAAARQEQNGNCFSARALSSGQLL